MDLTVRDATRFFKVSEKTIYRWIKEKGLPTQRVQDQYRFSRASLLEWAWSKNLSVSPEILGEQSFGQNLIIPEAIAEGGIHYGIPGKTRQEALSAIAERVKLPSSFAARELTELLLAREELSSTGVGEGIAIPHVRDPIVLPITRPSLSLCFLEKPIDFGAIDGKQVHTFFLLLSTTIRIHLQILSRIVYLLHNRELLEMLKRREKAEKLIETIRGLEREMGKSEGDNP